MGVPHQGVLCSAEYLLSHDIETTIFDLNVLANKGSNQEIKDTFTYSDDIWFSAKLKHDVKIYVVPYSKEEHHETIGRPKQLEYAKEDNCLYKIARANHYAKWDTALRKYRSKLLRDK